MNMSQEVALLCCFSLSLVGSAIGLICYLEDASKRTQRFWQLWAVVWGLPVFVQLYLTAWLGS